MKKTLPLFVLVAPMLVACGGGTTSTPASSISQSSSSQASSSEPTPSYNEKEINAHYVNKELNQKTKLRFYESTGDIPYMPIDDYYALLLKGRSEDPNRSKLTITVSGDLYTVTSTEGTATFDVAKDTMSSDNLAFFVSTKTYATGYAGQLGTDGLPWIKAGDIDVKNDPKKTIVDFTKYHIDLFGEGKRLYLPVPTLQDLFSDSDMLVSIYNRNDLYFYCAANEKVNAFGIEVYEPALKTDLGKNYAQYLYDEMCFDYDFLLGRPTRSSLEQYYDLSQGLDKALESRELGKLIKQYLTDGTALGYATGLDLLGRLMEDGGHTSVGPFTSIIYDAEKQKYLIPSWQETIGNQVRETIGEIEKKGYEELVNYCQGYDHQEYMLNNRITCLGLDPEISEFRGESTYKKVDSTAFIFIDDYMGDFYNSEAWKDYYDGKGELPYGESTGGAVASLYKGVLKAQEDSSVENVVIDLANNTGGSVDEMMYVVSLLTGDSTLYLENRMTDQRMSASFQVDRNLDTKFDEQDAAFNPLEGKKVAVLMSQNGFSCGGISPLYLHDSGIFTLGDDSGGGCCSVLYQHTGVGLRTGHSSTNAVVTKAGKKIDEARAGSCDHKFEITVTEGEDEPIYDFSAFYNVPEIERLIAKHYAS